MISGSKCKQLATFATSNQQHSQWWKISTQSLSHICVDRRESNYNDNAITNNITSLLPLHTLMVSQSQQQWNTINNNNLNNYNNTNPNHISCTTINSPNYHNNNKNHSNNNNDNEPKSSQSSKLLGIWPDWNQMWQNKNNRSTKSLFAVSIASFTTNVSADDGSSGDGAQGMISGAISKVKGVFSLDIDQDTTNMESLRSEMADTEFSAWFFERWLKTPISYVSDGLEIFHFGLGLPWYATIGITAVSIRLVCMPFLMTNVIQVSKLFDCVPISRLIMDEYKRKKLNNEFTSSGEERKFFMKYFRETSNISGFSISKLALYPLSLLVSVLPFVLSARQLVRRTNHDLNEGGLLWIQDLTAPDMYSITPFIAVGLSVTVLMFRSGKWLDRSSPHSINFYQRAVRWFFYGWNCYLLCMLAANVSLPSGIFCYWIPFSLMGLMSKMVLFSNRVREAIGVPLLGQLSVPTEPNGPKLNKFYHTLLQQFKRRSKSKRPVYDRTKSKYSNENEKAKKLKDLQEIQAQQIIEQSFYTQTVAKLNRIGNKLSFKKKKQSKQQDESDVAITLDDGLRNYGKTSQTNTKQPKEKPKPKLTSKRSKMVKKL